jgi:hypothetical protein
MEKFRAEQAGDPPAVRVERDHIYDAVADLLAERVKKSEGRMSAKRMLPITRAQRASTRFTTAQLPG